MMDTVVDDNFFFAEWVADLSGVVWVKVALSAHAEFLLLSFICMIQNLLEIKLNSQAKE